VGGRQKTFLIMERPQIRVRRKIGRRAEPKEKKIREIELNEDKIKEIKETVRKMKCITPAEISIKFDLRLSIVKDLLEEMEKAGEIIRISKNRRTIIYKPSVKQET